MNVLCSAGGCIHNKDGGCDKEMINIAWKPSRDFQAGERVYFPSCEDCEEEEEED